MIVELYGLPGTGKSTIARAIESQGKFKRIKINSKIELLWYNFLFFLKSPFKFFKLLFYIFRNSNNWQIFYYKLMNLFLHCNAKYQKVLKYQYALIDQGYFQNIISLFEQQVDWEIIQKYLANIVLPDKLFIFQVDDQERQKRLLNRGHGLRQFQDEKIKDIWLKASQANNLVFLENLANTKVQFFIITNDKSVEQVLNEINFLFH
ncbi:MAG: hypothetical protein UR94_C0001G0020 [Parcubacteria group bacterium GW2011_GWA2_36_10]|nr:MAG: hypothetical protein UR94_C0001G0020 [Parcubacteria group bacterium GW2011_GWA2_36_10]